MPDIKNPHFIEKIMETIQNANFTKKSLDLTLDEIIEEIYWKGAKEQNKT